MSLCLAGLARHPLKAQKSGTANDVRQGACQGGACSCPRVLACTVRWQALAGTARPACTRAQKKAGMVLPFQPVIFFPGAEGETRTPTPLRELDPEPSVSTNSTTSARKREIHISARICKENFCGNNANCTDLARSGRIPAQNLHFFSKIQ